MGSAGLSPQPVRIDRTPRVKVRYRIDRLRPIESGESYAISAQMMYLKAEETSTIPNSAKPSKPTTDRWESPKKNLCVDDSL
jgi:hypothetical protein